MRKLTYLIGTSIDGFIADPTGSIDAFFPLPEGLAEHLVAEYPETLPTSMHANFGITSGNKRFDTVVMGRTTYEPALQAGITSPYAHLEQYVVSGTLDTSTEPSVHIVPGDPVDLVRELKRGTGGGIWLAGGSRLAGALFGEIDELVVKVYPIALGAGIPMFTTESVSARFALTDSHVTSGGATVLTYAAN